MIKHMMPKEEERAETWGWEYMNCVVLQLIERMLDEMDESYMRPSDEARIRDFKKWIPEYIEEMSEKLAEEKRDIPSLIRKACLYD